MANLNNLIVTGRSYFGTPIKANGSELTGLNASNIASGTVPLARIPTGTNSATVSLGNHTHTTSLATDTGTSSITLSHGGKYKLTAGGNSVIFTLPSDNNTDTKVTQSVSTTANFRPLILGSKNDTNTANLTATATEQVYAAANLYVQPSTGTLYATKLSGSGASLTSLNASNVSSGILAIARGGTGGNTAANARANLACLGGDKGSTDHYGIVLPNGATTGYIRVPESGIIPISSCSSGKGNLGTSSWPFLNIYAKNHYGSGAGLTSINASNISSGTLGLARLPSTVIKCTSVSSNIDLNDYKTTGCYWLNGYTFTNMPTDTLGTVVNGWLLVLGATSNSVKQILYRLGTKNVTDHYTYERTLVGGEWSNWTIKTDNACRVNYETGSSYRDLNDTRYYIGQTTFFQNDSTVCVSANFPLKYTTNTYTYSTSKAGFLQVLEPAQPQSGTIDNRVQIFYGAGPGALNHLVFSRSRATESGTTYWSEWCEHLMCRRINTNLDFNKIRASGIYYLSSDYNYTNAPPSIANGWLMVLGVPSSSDGGLCKQIFFRQGSASTSLYIYHRTNYSTNPSTWSSWATITQN